MSCIAGNVYKTARYLLLLLSLPLCGCASSSLSVEIQSPYDGGTEMSGEERLKSDLVLREIEERNRAIEKDPAWIKESYNGFMIKGLADVNEKDYAHYSQYLDNRAIYIIVHPAYYTFFSDSDKLPEDPEKEEGMSGRNAVERLLEASARSYKINVMKAQEKMLRDFLEFASTEKKLVILVLPGGYRTYSGYRYRKNSDEYMRFINEASNGSDSVLYVFSRKTSKGTLSEDDRALLLKFIYGIRADSVLLGGGYVGRCLEDFYKSVEPYIGEDKIYVVPELTAISPSDMTRDLAAFILRSDGTLDAGRLSYCIIKNAIGNQDITPLIRNLSAAGRTP